MLYDVEPSEVSTDDFRLCGAVSTRLVTTEVLGTIALGTVTLTLGKSFGIAFRIALSGLDILNYVQDSLSDTIFGVFVGDFKSEFLFI